MNKNQKEYVTFDLGVEADPSNATILAELDGFLRSAKKITFLFKSTGYFADAHINEAKRRVKYNSESVDSISYKVHGATDPIRVGPSLQTISGPIHSVRLSNVSLGADAQLRIMVS